MICVAISDNNYGNCLDVLEKIEMAEIRLDLVDFNYDQISQVFSMPKKLIATYRPVEGKEEERLPKLKAAIEAGAKYVDIEYESAANYRNDLIRHAHKCNCDVIISYHNFEYTPDCSELEHIVEQSFAMKADVVKVVTTVNTNLDNSKIISLYKLPGRVVAFGMGNLGKITRIIAPFLGAEFTFAAMDEKLATAPGQIAYSKIRSIIQQIENA